MNENLFDDEEEEIAGISFEKPKCATFPWCPLPTEMVVGRKFAIFEEDRNLQCEIIEECVCIRADPCGFFLYWESSVDKVTQLIDLGRLEDVESCNIQFPMNSEILTDNSIECLRLQFPAIGSTQSKMNPLVGNDVDPSYRSLYLQPLEAKSLKIWEETILKIGFQYRQIHENYSILDVLMKQWTYLKILYCADSLPTSVAPSTSNVIPACCLSEALGKPAIAEGIRSIPVTLFTFEVFFALFIQAWPREDIEDLYVSYSDINGRMGFNGLTDFINSTVSQNTVTANCPTVKSFHVSRRPRKVKHVGLLQWEAKHLYSRKKQSSRINEHSGKSSVHLRSKSEQNRAKKKFHVRQTTVVSQSRSPSPGGVTDGETCGCKVTQESFGITRKDFESILQLYETNPENQLKGYLSSEGFYRFLLSSEYIRLSRSKCLEVGCIGQHSAKLFGRPLAHYYIETAQLVSSGKESPIALHEILFLRAIRQLLLLGTRCLIFDCFVMTESDAQSRILMAGSSILHQEHINKNSWRNTTSLSEEIPRDFYARIQTAFATINSVGFLITPYPLLLILRLDSLSVQDQIQLATSLQKCFGSTLLCPPLPRFVPQDDDAYGTYINQIYFQAHHPLPSPELLKHRILLSVVHLPPRGASPKQCNQHNSVGEAECIKPNETAPLRVFVTDPEGEEKLPKQDTVSTGSGGQSTPKICRKATYTEPAHPGTGSEILKTYTEPAVFPGQRQCHPRLMRLICLLGAVQIPALALFLLMRHNLSTIADVHSTKCDARMEKMRNLNIYQGDQQKAPNLSSSIQNEIEVLTLLSSLIFAKTSQALHQRRKKRLLHRLVSEAFKETKRTRQVPTSHDHNKAQTTTWERPTQDNTAVDLTQTSDKRNRNAGIRQWFAKRRISPSPLPKPTETRRSSILSAATNAARRLSNASLIKWEKNSNEKSVRGSQRQPSVSGELFARMKRKMSFRSSEGSSANTTEILPPSSPLELPDVKKRLSSTSISSVGSERNSTWNINDSNASRQLVTYRTSKYKSNKKGTCGRCSCSSGSKSSANSSPEHGFERKRSERTKFFRNSTENAPHNPLRSNRNSRGCSRTSGDQQSQSESDTTSSNSSVFTEETSFTSSDSGGSIFHSSVSTSSESQPGSPLDHSRENGYIPTGYQPNYGDRVEQVQSDICRLNSTLNKTMKQNPVSLDSDTWITAWKQTNQWLTKCKVVSCTQSELLSVISDGRKTRSIAEYSKIRLIYITTTEDSANETSRQLFRLLGCQLVPVVVQPHHRTSIREQISLACPIERTQSRNMSGCHGYTLKPKRLRMNTSLRFHRYPTNWLHTRHARHQNVPLGDGRFAASQKWPYAECTCCYDPLSEANSPRLVKQLYIESSLCASKWNISEPMNKALPTGISLKPLKYMMASHELDTSLTKKEELREPPGVSSCKLPRRYHRAVSSAPKRTHESSTGECTRESTSCQTIESNVQKREQLTSHFNLEVKFLAPMNEATQQFETSIELSPYEMKRKSLTDHSIPHARTFADIHGMLASSGHRESNHNPSKMPTSKSMTIPHMNELLMKPTLNKLKYFTTPELAVMSLTLKNSIPDATHSPNECIAATSVWSAFAHPRGFVTGYQHIKLQLNDSRGTQQAKEISWPTCVAHHDLLRSNFGVPIFCKIDTKVYAPPSLCEVADTLSQELASRCNSSTILNTQVSNYATSKEQVKCRTNSQSISHFHDRQEENLSHGP